MDPSMTLQDFVLNLIYDPAARSAFELDPESSLQHAGLGDITAADVQQVIPLVVDSAPVSGLNAPGGVDNLATGVANLDVAGAVSHLQAITNQLSYSAAFGVVTGDTGLSLDTSGPLGSVNGVGAVGAGSMLTGSVLTGADVRVGDLHVAMTSTTNTTVDLGGLNGGHDPALHLDSGVGVGAVTPVTQTVSDLHTTVDHTAPALDTTVGGTLDTATHLPSSLPLDTSSLDGTGVTGAGSAVGSIVKPDLSHVLSTDPVETVHSTVTSVTGGHDLTGGLLDGVTHPTETSSDPLHDLLGGLHQ